MQLELINESLAALQVKHKELNKPRTSVGFRMDWQLNLISQIAISKKPNPIFLLFRKYYIYLPCNSGRYQPCSMGLFIDRH